MKIPILFSGLLFASINCMQSGLHKTAVKLLENSHDYINPEHDSCVDQILTAIDQGNTKKLKKILKGNPNQSVNIRVTLEGQYPIHLAALQVRNGHDIIKILIMHNADINCLDNEGKTPLASAAGANNTKAITLLLKEGAIRFWENNQANPYYHGLRNGSIEAIKLLIGLNIRVSKCEVDLANEAMKYFETKPKNSFFYVLRANAIIAKGLFEEELKRNEQEKNIQQKKYINLEQDKPKSYLPWHRNIFKRP